MSSNVIYYLYTSNNTEKELYIFVYSFTPKFKSKTRKINIAYHMMKFIAYLATVFALLYFDVSASSSHREKHHYKNKKSHHHKKEHQDSSEFRGVWIATVANIGKYTEKVKFFCGIYIV